MKLTGLAIGLGIGAAAGAVAVMMMPRNNPARKLAAKAADKVEDAAWMFSDKLCKEIDTDILVRLGKKSIYELTHKEKKQIALSLMRKYHVPAVQVRRCLALHDE